MPKPKIALQLYSVREDCAKDLRGTLKAVAAMGYEGVELAGHYGYSAEEWKKFLDGFGLQLAGAHLSLDTLLGENLAKTVEFQRTISNINLVVPGLPPERTGSKSAWLETAKIFGEIAGKLKGQGMRLGYHNHMIEFQPLNGEAPWDLFFQNTGSDIFMQLDTGNAMHGGVSADKLLEIMRRYPGRQITVHLKEFSATNDKAVIGEGDMKWKEFFSLCETTGNTEWYIVEQESYAHPPLECVRLCLDNLRKIMARG
jgi:sugar phosphate isomerase/epimerase